MYMYKYKYRDPIFQWHDPCIPANLTAMAITGQPWAKSLSVADMDAIRDDPPPLSRRPMGKGQLTPDEMAEIICLTDEGKGDSAIATRLGRHVNTVTNFKRRMQSRVNIAKAMFKAKADVLADRVIKQANVGESLEVLDRIEVLPKRQQAPPLGGFNLYIGMPGQPVPSPSEADIQQARSIGRGVTPRALEVGRQGSDGQAPQAPCAPDQTEP